MDRLDAMRSFLAIAERGSFAEAARRLRISPAAATRAVAALEAELGLTLLHRTTRSVRLTDRGALYAERCRAILAEIEDAERLVRGEDASPRGLLSVTAPVMFGRLHVMPVAELLAAAHPALALRLVFVDRVVHLAEEGFDIAVRIGHLPDSALVAVPVAQVRRVLVASPDYLAKHGEPSTPAELKRHRTVGFDGIGSTDDWRFGPDGRTGVTVSPRLSVNSADAAIDAAVRGAGIARALSYQVEEAVRENRLRRILTGFEGRPLPVSLVHPPNRRGAPNVVAFMQAARGYLAGRRWE